MKISHSLPANEGERSMLGRSRFRNNEAMVFKATIESYEIDEANRQRYVLYTIRLQNILFDFRVKKRFSDFEKFDALLRTRYPKELFPKLPEKFYINNFDRGKILARMTKLERYLNELLFDFESREPMTEISEFIGLKKQDMASIMDMNQSNYQFNGKTDLAFVRLIYQAEDLQANLDELKQLVFSTPQTLKTARLIMKGDKSIKSIFAFAFESHEGCLCPAEESRGGQRKVRFSSFNENNPSARGDSVTGRRIAPVAPQGAERPKIIRPRDENKPDCAECRHKGPGIHFTCAAVLTFLLELLDYSRNPSAEVYRTAFREVEIGLIDHENFRRHLCAREFTLCKINCYQLLKIYKDICRSSKQLNECLLFNRNEEYRNFLHWYNRQTHCARRDALFADYEQQFPKVNQLLLRESLHRDSLFRAMDFFMEKHVINTLMIDEQRQISKLNFLIREDQRAALIESLLEFKWSPNILQVVRQSALNSNVFLVGSDHVYNLYLFSRKSQDGQTDESVFVDWLKTYRVDKGARTVLLLAPQDLTVADKEDIVVRFTSFEQQVNISVEERDVGFFIDIEPSREHAGKLLVSILLHYSFMDKRNDRLIGEYRYLSNRIWLVKRYCDQFAN